MVARVIEDLAHTPLPDPSGQGTLPERLDSAPAS
jgi:hypothetical protein